MNLKIVGMAQDPLPLDLPWISIRAPLWPARPELPSRSDQDQVEPPSSGRLFSIPEMIEPTGTGTYGTMSDHPVV